MGDLVINIPEKWGRELCFADSLGRTLNPTGIFLAAKDKLSFKDDLRFRNFRSCVKFNYSVTIGDVTLDVTTKAFNNAFELNDLWSYAILVGTGTGPIDGRRETFYFRSQEDAIMFRMKL